ncbi:MAG: hypothetical protein ACE5JC_10255, partial [Candidatus Zixiibacteriota bacterium]
MDLRRVLSVLSVLLFLLVVSHFALAHPVFAAELTVEVLTDREEYESGEAVTITVRVYLDGQLVPANIDRAYIEISYGAGYTYRNYITRDFTQVSPGVFIATGEAGRAGSRQIYVAAHMTITEDCCRETVCGFGFAYFSVKQVYHPCYQPCVPSY